MVSRRNLVIGGVAVIIIAGVGATLVQNKQSSTDKKDFSVAMVTDVGGVDDRSFNQSAWKELLTGESHITYRRVRMDIITSLQKLMRILHQTFNKGFLLIIIC